MLSLLTSFVDWFMAYFLYCSPYSYRSSNYRDSDSCHSFSILRVIAKSKQKLFASWKSDNYRKENKGNKEFDKCCFEYNRNILLFSGK